MSKKYYKCGPGTFSVITHNTWSGDYEDWEESWDDDYAEAVNYDLAYDSEELAPYVSDEYLDKIRKVAPVKVIEINGSPYTVFEVDADDDVPQEYITEYILGQCSDGWGEGYEQSPVISNRVEESEYEEVYFSPWTPEAEVTEGLTL